MSKLSPVPQGREIILPNRASPPRESKGGQHKKGKSRLWRVARETINSSFVVSLLYQYQPKEENLYFCAVFMRDILATNLLCYYGSLYNKNTLFFVNYLYLEFTNMKKVLLLCLIILTANIVPLKAQNDFEIAKNVDIFVSILKELNAKYADEVVPGDLVKTAIDAMLKDLDPYSVYYPESQIEDVRMMTTGQYGGIGSLVHQQDGYVVISEPYEGTPSQKAGLLPGDRILSVNGKSTKGKSSEDVVTALKGQPGTKVVIEIERPTNGKKMTFSVDREDIQLPTVSYYGMLKDNVGYIKLDQFTEKASAEVKDAFLKLKEQGMDKLVLDLRNNGGGLLMEAVNIMNIFVDQKVMIAETKGKIPELNKKYYTRNPVTDKDIPVVVLVNEHSASASEIVSGAFQDLDRGVIVGKKTFGKGLVQNVLPLNYNTSFKITVSKYYIPSGRCVQNIDYFNKDTNNAAVHIPDSLATPFKTQNGRTVYDKGGVEPDVITKDSLVSNLLLSLILNNIIFDYANLYHANHDSIAAPDKFKFTDTDYADFLNFIKDKDYTYQTETEKLLEKLKKTASDEQYFGAIEDTYEVLQKKIEEDKASDIQKFKEEISLYIASEIVARYYYQKGRVIFQLSEDPDIAEAMKILLDSKRYQKILSGK